MQIFGRARRCVIVGSSGYQSARARAFPATGPPRISSKHIRRMNRNDIQRSEDLKLEPGMRRAERAFDEGGIVSTGKNESRITRTFGKGQQFLPGFRGNHHIDNAWG